MRKILLSLFILLLAGCSIDGLAVWGELNKVQVVQYNTYVKSYRAYFQRSHLRTIRHGKKYLFFYNKKSRDLAILLHPKNRYILYSFSRPNKVIRIRSDRKHGYYHMIKALRHKGYRVTAPHTVGYTTKVSLRIYKKVKTYRVEVKDYQHLQNLYKHAIRSYDAGKITKISTRLPKVLIDPYYKKYKAQATTWEQLRALDLIADKLRLEKPVATKEKLEKPVTTKEKTVYQKTQPKITHNTQEDNAKQIYIYYLKKASSHELDRYLSGSEAKKTLSYEQYNTLKRRNNYLKEKKLLENGSLEELITAYKKNKNPKYKSKIMQRIKEIQKK